eukprot:1160156-Pelagomonas_calceolata.AAC.2
MRSKLTSSRPDATLQAWHFTEDQRSYPRLTAPSIEFKSAACALEVNTVKTQGLDNCWRRHSGSIQTYARISQVLDLGASSNPPDPH